MTSWVLVVTPDRRQQQSVCEELEGAGFAVEIATNVDAALACLAVMKPTLLVIDDHLEDADRLRLAVRFGVPEPTASIPIVTIPGAITTRSA